MGNMANGITLYISHDFLWGRTFHLKNDLYRAVGRVNRFARAMIEYAVDETTAAWPGPFFRLLVRLTFFQSAVILLIH